MSADQAYGILGLGRGASQQKIRHTYLRLAIRHHPDKQQQHGIESDPQQFREINDAYVTLLNHRVARFDRSIAEQDAKFEQEIAAAEAELAGLEEEQRQRSAVRDQQSQRAFEERQEKRKQHIHMRMQDAFVEKALPRPPAVVFQVVFQKVFFFWRPEENRWLAEDGSRITYSFPTRYQRFPTWLLQLEGSTGAYLLHDSPHPFNSFQKDTYVWATWEFDAGLGRRPVPTRILNRGAYPKELRERSKREEEAQRAAKEQQEKAEEQQRIEKKRKQEAQKAEEKRKKLQQWQKVDAIVNRIEQKKAPLMIEFHMAVGASFATPKVQADQRVKAAKLKRRLQGKWKAGRDDASLRRELAQMRCALHFQVFCEDGFWTRVDGKLPSANKEFIERFLFEELELGKEKEQALKETAERKKALVEKECDILMKSFPDATNRCDAAVRAAKGLQPLTKHTAAPGQRVIVYISSANAISGSINGSWGELLRKSQREQCWLVRLDGNAGQKLCTVHQPLKHLFLVPDQVTSPPASGTSLRWQQEAGEDPPSKRAVKRPRQALPLPPDNAKEHSDGFGSDSEDSGEDSEAHDYKKRLQEGDDRAARLIKRAAHQEEGASESEAEPPRATSAEDVAVDSSDEDEEDDLPLTKWPSLLLAPTATASSSAGGGADSSSRRRAAAKNPSPSEPGSLSTGLEAAAVKMEEPEPKAVKVACDEVVVVSQPAAAVAASDIPPMDPHQKTLWATYESCLAQIGMRVEVWWDGDTKLFPGMRRGTIDKANPDRAVHITYDNGDEKWHWMWTESYNWLKPRTDSHEVASALGPTQAAASIVKVDSDASISIAASHTPPQSDDIDSLHASRRRRTAAPTPWQHGDRVKCLFIQDGKEMDFEGTVVRVHTEFRSCDVQFDDGESKRINMVKLTRV